MIPDLSVGVIIAIVVVTVVIIALCLIAYCVFNREDVLDETSNTNQYKYTELNNYDTEVSKGKMKPVKGILAGLENANRECYMNSIVQALACSNILYDQLKKLEVCIPFCKSLKILQELIDGLNDDTPYRSAENNTALLRALVKSIKWNEKHKYDAYEFLSAIINDIQRELNDIKAEMNPPLTLNVKYKYSGVNIPDEIQVHLGLSLELCGEYEKPPGVTIDFLISKYFSTVLIDEDPKKTMQLFIFKSSPSVLMLYIQANKWNDKLQQMVKPTFFIKYEEHLNLDLEIMLNLDNNEVSKENLQYKLMAVVHHTGSYSTGHYVTYRQYAEDWFLTNDKKIEYITFDYNVSPYILVYEKI